MKYVAPLLQITGLGLITIAFVSFSLIAGLAVGGISLLLIGLSLESSPLPLRRGR